MTADLITYAFVAGELSESLFGRTDLEKYDFGLAKAQNFFVEYRGGISTRAGTEFIDYVQHDDKATKFIPFRFAPNLANTYVILFGHQYIRFIQDGAYVLEADVAVSNITADNPGAVTATAHGFSAGDWVYLSGVSGMTEVNGRLFEVIAPVSTNAFHLADPFGNDFDTSGFTVGAGGTANRVYTVTSPYDADDLAELKAWQIRDFVRLTHPDFPIKNLVRTAATNWAISNEAIANGMTRPTGVAGVASGSGTASVAYAVTAVSKDGEESLASDIEILETIVNITDTAGSVTLTWTAVSDARYYNIYRSNFFPGAGTGTAVTRAAQLGFLGQSFGPTFTDTNIIPDFTSAPPRGENPFADGAITNIEVTAGGTGYAKDDTVSVSGGGGSGFVGFPVVDDSGAIIAVVIQSAGSGYSSPTVSFGTSGGSGATATATAGSSSGNKPAVSAIFQQRQVYAGTDNEPLTIFGSRPGRFSNFDGSEIVTDGDAYEHEVESEEVSKIEHLLPTHQGLLVFSLSGIWRLHGGSEAIVTALNATADLQSARGSSAVRPLEISSNILFVEGKSLTVRFLEYSELRKAFEGTDVSILSNHLFAADKQITGWDYAQNPHNVVWAVRSDGAFLSFTLVKDQEVFAWTPHTTRGLVKDVVVVRENELDRAYFMVERYINGRWTKFIERMAPRIFDHVEDAFCVDCGLSRTLTYPAATLTMGAATGTGVTFTASASVFVAGDVGKFIFAGGGKAEVTAYVSGTEVTCTFIRDVTAIIPEDESNRPLPVLSGDWSMNAASATFSGLHHLEGETLRILGDGNVFPEQTVVGGAITLSEPVSKLTVGLGYNCIARTLPPTASDVVIEGRRKDVVGTAVRVKDTRGLSTGATLSSLREFKERTTEDYAEPTMLQQGMQHALIDADWDDNGQTYYAQYNPLPATVLGIVTTLDVGDD